MSDVDQEEQARTQNELCEAARALVEEFGWTKRQVLAEVESVL